MAVRGFCTFTTLPRKRWWHFRRHEIRLDWYDPEPGSETMTVESVHLARSVCEDAEAEMRAGRRPSLAELVGRIEAL